MQAAGDQFVGECLVVDEGAARRVDEGGSVPHQGQAATVEHADGLRCDRCVQAHHVAAAQQFVEVHLAPAQRTGLGLAQIGIADEDVQVEGAQ